MYVQIKNVPYDPDTIPFLIVPILKEIADVEGVQFERSLNVNYFIAELAVQITGDNPVRPVKLQVESIVNPEGIVITIFGVKVVLFINEFVGQKVIP